MKTKQYIEAGEAELENDKFYKHVEENLCDDVKQKCDKLVNDMLSRKEISESVAIYLLSGEKISQHFITS